MCTISITLLHSDCTIRTFAIHAAGSRRNSIHATVTRHAAVVRSWIHHTLLLHRRHRRRLVVGLGVQCKPSSDPRPSVLNLCVGHRCLLFQLVRSTSIPNSLKRFLDDREIRFVAVRVAHDRMLLGERWGLRVRNAVEIRVLAESIMGKRNASMEAMAREILGFGFVGTAKAATVGRSDWEVPILSGEQIVYASVDAYVSFRLGLRLT